MKYLTKFEAPVLGFSFLKQYVDCLCKNKLIKIEKNSGKVVYEREVLKKDGLSRILIADNGQIFLSDFCTLYMFDGNKYELVNEWQIGYDLSSDICGMLADKNTIYCSVRNGRLVAIDRSSFDIKEYNVSDSSMWSLKAYDKYILCGTVDGSLLFINKEIYETERRITLGKKNIRSLYINDGILYAAGQDKQLFKINLSSLEITDIKRNVHKKMFNCVGLYDNMFITISYPCSEIAIWDKNTLEKIKGIQIPLKLCGCTCIDEDKLYICSRNIPGIGMIDLHGIL